MSDPSGGPSSLGIEAVEWLAEGGENIMLRVTGRWRRRRPTWTGQPMLVIEAQGQRHRFPAMPEPPSLTGAAPGTWRMSFSVPPSLAPHLGGRAWLALGAVVVPLPAAVEPALGAKPEGEGEGEPPPAEAGLGADPDLLMQRRLRSYELAVEAARRRAADAEAGAEELSARIEQLEMELDRLTSELADRERARRSAEQRAHSERVLREELQEELAEPSRSREHTGTAMADLAEADARIAELEEEIETLRRRVDEAEQLAAAAQARRRQAERQLTAGPEPRWGRSSPPLPTRGDSRLLGLERELAARHEATAAREQPPAPRAVTVAAPAPERLPAALAELRAELAELRAGAERESIARERAQARAASLELRLVDQTVRSTRAYDAIEALRLELEAVRVLTGAPAGAVPRPEPASAAPGRVEAPGGIDPARLAAALVRLREAAEVPAEGELTPSRSDAQPLGHPWLPRVFRALVARDPSAGGRLVVALLPAQRPAGRERIDYDLVLTDLGCLRVSAAGGRTRVEVGAAPRPLGQVDFRVSGDLAGLARLLLAGRLRRRLGRRLAAVEGDREAFAELRGLIHAPLSLSGLHAAGVRPDPWLSLTLAALLIDPARSAGERFTIGHREPDSRSPGVYLHVRGGAQPTVTRIAPIEVQTSTVVCPAESLLLVLGGSPSADAEVRGDERPLALLQSWCKRAQSG